MTKDIIILVPDKNTQFAIDGLLSRPQAFGIRTVGFDIYVHPERDPGVYNRATDFLSILQDQYSFALVFLDREGSGHENEKADAIYSSVKIRLENRGWQDRAEVIVFDPELEIWAWVNSPHLVNNIGWSNFDEVREFMIQNQLWRIGSQKPDRPKEAFELALREKQMRRSSAIYRAIASKSSFKTCQETSFLFFKNTLQRWFANP